MIWLRASRCQPRKAGLEVLGEAKRDEHEDGVLIRGFVLIMLWVITFCLGEVWVRCSLFCADPNRLLFVELSL